MATKDKSSSPPPESPEPGNGKDWGESVGALLDEIKRRFPAVERKDARVVGEPALFALPKDTAELASFLKDNDVCSFNYCRSVTGVDKVDRFEVVYNLARIPGPGQAADEDFETIGMVVVIDDREKPALPSLTQVWPGVGLQEREVYDLLGIVFEGHPDLRRILLDEAFVGHPLRKSYPLEGRWEDMEATDAYLDERQTRTMREEAGLDYRPEDVPPSFKR